MNPSRDSRRTVAQLRRAVSNALRTPFMRKRVEEVSLRRIRSIEDFAAAIPPLTIEELRKGWEEDQLSLGNDGRRDVGLIAQTAHDPPVYVTLSNRALELYAEVLADCWLSAGVLAGSHVLIHDYGTSPLVYLASRNFCPYLKTGAAERVGCIPICNDGLPEFTERALHILRFVRPRAIFLRQDAVTPLVTRLSQTQEKLRLGLELRAVVISSDEVMPPRDDREHAMLSGLLGAPVTALLRADAALFMASECAKSGRLHVRTDRYFVETLDPTSLRPTAAGELGMLAITPLFCDAYPVLRYVTGLEAALDPGGCVCGTADVCLSTAA
jgi:phenylacetate-coenzyme A ligase PaaK-like adenylate-forming protein